jgi:DNA replication protein DnaC
MIPTDDELDALLKRLHLASARRIWRRLVERAEKEEWSYRDFLGILVAEEIAQRQQTRLQRLSRSAVFPFLKTIDDFDFTYQSTLRLSLLGSALSSDFITEGRCLILSGKPGRGKTHLAVAIAYRAIQNGFDAVFTTAAQLIDELSAAFRVGGLAAALANYTRPALLVVDEVGYLTYGTDAANMLFHVVNDRHRRKRSMIFTTAATADTRQALEGALAKLGDAGYFNVYDRQPPEPGKDAVRIGGIYVEPDGGTRFERDRDPSSRPRCLS